MKLPEAIAIIEAQAVTHSAAAWTPTEPGVTKRKEWCKTIVALDKSIRNGYSLVGDFWDKRKELEPGLFLIFTVFSGQRIVEKLTPKREGLRRLRDDSGNIIFELADCTEYFEERRALLFDFDGDRAKLEHFTWLPRRNWAKELWFPVENWLEIQPNIETKIKFWEAEVALRTNSLHQAQQRLDALKRQIATDSEELDPGLNKWLQTGAVLGGKKATGQRSLEQ